MARWAPRPSGRLRRAGAAALRPWREGLGAGAGPAGVCAALSPSLPRLPHGGTVGGGTFAGRRAGVAGRPGTRVCGRSAAPGRATWAQGSWKKRPGTQLNVETPRCLAENWAVEGDWVWQQRWAASASSERGLGLLVCALPGGWARSRRRRAAVGLGTTAVSVLAQVGILTFGRWMQVSALLSGERSGAGRGAKARPSKFLGGLEVGVCYRECAGAGRSRRALGQRVCQAAAGGDRLPGGPCSGAATGALPALLLKEEASEARICSGLVNKLYWKSCYCAAKTHGDQRNCVSPWFGERKGWSPPRNSKHFSCLVGFFFTCM